MGLATSQEISLPEEIYTTIGAHLTPLDLFTFLSTTKSNPYLLNWDRYWTERRRTDFGSKSNQLSTETTPEGIFKQLYKANRKLKRNQKLIWGQRIYASDYVIRELQKIDYFHTSPLQPFWDVYPEPATTNFKDFCTLLSLAVCQEDLPVVNQILDTLDTWSPLCILTTFNVER